MRWIEKPPRYLEQRVITKFALLPIKVQNGEVRWLEKVTIKQTYVLSRNGKWRNDCFVDVQ